jgi:hypothetical protein
MLHAKDQPTALELRLQIARLRRRIDGDLHSAERRGRELLSWRTYVQRYPVYAALAAAGFGMAVAAGLRRGRLPRWLGRQLVGRAADRILGDLWQELRDFWAHSDSKDR